MSVGERTEVLTCTCQHEYQDKKYGKGMRVHNKAAGNKGTEKKWRCTVCGATREK